MQALEQAPLRGGLGQTARQGLARVAHGVLDDADLGAALRHADLAFALGLAGERLLQQLLVGERVAEQDRARHRLVVVELGDEALQHLLDPERAVGAREIGAVAPVLTRAEEEDLDAGVPALLVGGEHVGLLDALGVDGLVGSDVRQRPQAVAILGGLLVVEAVGRLLHEALIHLPRVLALAAQEAHRLLDQRIVVLEADLAGAGRRAALDLIEQAGTRAALEHGIRAGAQQEGPLQHVDGAVDGAGGGERPEVVALAVARAAVLEDLRCGMPARDQDVGEGLVVPEQNIVARTKALDQVGLEQQGLGLGAHRHELHGGGGGDHAGDAVGVVGGARVVGYPGLKVARLADVDDGARRIDHAVDAGRAGQGLEIARDHSRAGLRPRLLAGGATALDQAAPRGCS